MVVVVVVSFHSSTKDAVGVLATGVPAISIQDKKTNSNLKMLAVNSLVAGAGRGECRVVRVYWLDPDIRSLGGYG